MIKYETIKEAMDRLVEHWGENGKIVIEEAIHNHKYIDFDEFLDNCVTCGGNWGGMFLSGLKKLYPSVYEAIPENMGNNSWLPIWSTMVLCGITVKNNA